MTKGEAIDYIKEWLKDEYALNGKDRIVLTMAIETLSNADQHVQHVGCVDLISRQDVVNEIHKYFVEEIDKTPTEIDDDGDELYADMQTVNFLLACNKELSKRIKSLPSVNAIPYDSTVTLNSPTIIKATSTDLISRQDAIDAAIDAVDEWDGGYNRTRESMIENAINSLPMSADRPTGEWIDKGDYAECSNCGGNSGTQFDGVQPIPRKTKFCPHCGARMIGKDGEEE